MVADLINSTLTVQLVSNSIQLFQQSNEAFWCAAGWQWVDDNWQRESSGNVDKDGWAYFTGTSSRAAQCP